MDKSDVRKIVQKCNDVQNVLSTSIHITSLKQLADFIHLLTPCMTQMFSEIDSRQEKLSIPSHSASLKRGIDQIKRLIPILISSNKLSINLRENNLDDMPESSKVECMVAQMSGEIEEIIRVLQLTTGDDCEQINDHAMSTHTKSSFENQFHKARSWLINSDDDPNANALYDLISSARQLGRRSNSSEENQAIITCCDELEELTSHLLQTSNENANEMSAEKIVPLLKQKLDQLHGLCTITNTITNDSSDQKPSSHSLPFRLGHNMKSQLVQVDRWLMDPHGPHRVLGLEACLSIARHSRSLLPPPSDSSDDSNVIESCLEACEHVERASKQLFQLTQTPPESEAFHPPPSLIHQDNRSRQARLVQSHELSQALGQSLACIWQTHSDQLVNGVSDNYTDLVGPLRKLADFACTPPSQDGGPITPTRLISEQAEFDALADTFMTQSSRMVQTANMALETVGLTDSARVSTLRDLSRQLPQLTQQLVQSYHQAASIGGGRWDSVSPNDQLTGQQQAIRDHVKLVKDQWSEVAEGMRQLIDETVDVGSFIRAQESGIERDLQRAEHCIEVKDTTGVVDASSGAARRANRILQQTKKELDNSEDPVYVDHVTETVNQLQATITPMIAGTSKLIRQIDNPTAQHEWRDASKDVLATVDRVHEVVAPSSEQTAPANFSFLSPAGKVYNAAASRRQAQRNGNGHETDASSQGPGGDTESTTSSSLSQDIAQLHVNANKLRRRSLQQHQSITSDRHRIKRQDSSPYSPFITPIHPTNPLLSSSSGYYTLVNSMSSCCNSPPTYYGGWSNNSTITNREHSIIGGGGTDSVASRTTDTEDEVEEFNFPLPEQNQPIMAAAHALHHETRLWTGHNNDLLTTTKEIAGLMAKLSQIVRGEYGSKKDLLTVSMTIAQASKTVEKCIQEIASDCTDRRIRNNLLGLKDRMSMIGNQLKILTTVKATMLEQRETEEDIETTESLVSNAKNLMQTVMETLHCASAASVKMRSDCGFELKWKPRTTTFESVKMGTRKRHSNYSAGLST